MIVRELISRIGFNIDRSQVDRVERTTDRIKERANMAAEAFRGIFAALASGAAVQSIVRIGDEMQSLQHRIGALTQTQGSSADGMEFVAKAAQDARQSVSAYASFFIKAGNATRDFIKDQDTLRQVVDGVAFGLAASGSGAVAQEQAFFQLGQAIGSPTVQMEEMNTLIDVAPDLFRALGDAIPGANGNLKAFISTGKVTGQMLAEGLIAVMPQFRNEITKMPMSVGTATTLIANKWRMMINRLNNESFFITRIANTIIAGFDKIEAGVNWLGEEFNGFSNVVRLALIAIGVVAVKWAAPFIASAVAATIAMAPMILALGLIALALDDVYSWMKGGESIIGRYILGPFDQFKNRVISTWETMKGFYNWIKDKFVAVGNIIGGVLTFDMDQIRRGLASFATTPTAQAGSNPARFATLPGSAQPRSIMANTTVNLTVPPGTSPTDAVFFSESAKKAFGGVNDGFARDLGVYAP